MADDHAGMIDAHGRRLREGPEPFWSRAAAAHGLAGNLTYPGFLARTARRLPDKTAMVFGERSLSYRQLFDAIRGATVRLRDDHGIGPGARVALLLENSDTYNIWYFAVMALGAVAVPLNVKLVPAEIAFMLQDAGCVLVLSEARFADTLRGIAPGPSGAPALRLLDGGLPSASPGVFDTGAVPIDADAAIYYTSGTTGRPKGVVHTHRSLIAGTLQGPPAWEYDSERVVNLAVTPQFHIANHTVFLPTLAVGGTLVIDTFGTERTFELIQRHRVTQLFAVPSILLLLTQFEDRDRFDLGSVTRVAFGAAPMPVHKLEAVQALFPNAALVHGMGQTECSGTTVTLPSPQAFEKAGSVGINIAGTEIRIVDEADAELPAGAVGELVTRGPNVMSRYLNRPEASAEALRGGWLHTGDLGYRDAQGYLYLVDRKKDMIIRGGENIYSSEVEQALYGMPGIALAAVVGQPSELFGEEVFAFLVAREGAPRLTLDEVQAHCAERLAKYKRPTAIRYLDALPQTATGKIQKGELKAMLAPPAARQG